MQLAKFENVYADEHIEAFFLPARSDQLLVTFNPAQLGGDGAKVWGTSTIRQLGWAGLGFMARRPNFFPRASIDAALERAGHPNRGFRDVVTLGWSMGGYGALKFARHVGATLAVSFSPQNPTVRAAMPDSLESRCPEAWVGRDVTWQDLPRRTVILYDPLNRVDQRSVEQIVLGGVPGCFVVPIWSGGHKSALPFVRSNQMAPLVMACWRGDLPALRRATSTARRLNPQRPVVLANYAAARHPPIAAALLARYADRFEPAELQKLRGDMAKAASTPGADRVA